MISIQILIRYAFILFYSNHRDNIFVYFVGHGTSGILAFPENYLYADELNNALQSLYSDHKFNSVRFLSYIHIKIDFFKRECLSFNFYNFIFRCSYT